MDILHANHVIHTEMQGGGNSQNNPGKEHSWRTHTFQFQNIPQSYNNEIELRNLYIQGQLNFNKCVKIIRYGKNSLQQMAAATLNILMQKNEAESVTLLHIQKLTQNGL